MRFFAERMRDRSVDEAERPDHPISRAVGIAPLASALHGVAAAIAERCGTAAPTAALSTILTVLWSRSHSFDAADALWPDRDRFVLSHPAGTPLLYGLLHLTGHPGMEQATLDHCGDLDAIASSAAEYGRHPAVEVSTAPGGQAIAAAVGMAIAERALAARFGKSLVDHRVWSLARADELTHGVSEEAAALAGLFHLDRLVLMVDATDPDAEDARARYAGFGWVVKSAAADESAAIEAALSFAARSRKPTLVWCVAPAKSGSVRVAPAMDEAWRRLGSRGAVKRRAWLKRIARHPHRAAFERGIAGRLSDDWQEPLNALRTEVTSARAPVSPAHFCRQAIEHMFAAMPELLCGTVDGIWGQGNARVAPGQCTGPHLGFGSRPYGMAACLNGIALHAGTVPVAAVAFRDTAEQLPALRLAALLGRRLVHLAVDPGLSRAGRAWVPAGLLPALRAIPNLNVFRPGSPEETAECLELAIRRADGPSLLILSDQPACSLKCDTAVNRCAKGAYVARDEVTRQATLIATGAELAIALAASRLLGEHQVAAAVVSMPCAALFCIQDEAYREVTLGHAPRFALEAAGRDGWDRWIGAQGTFIGGDPPTCGPADAIRERLGLTPELVAGAVMRRLGLVIGGAVAGSHIVALRDRHDAA